MNPDSVFKAYDVRGRTDNGELDERLFYLTGNAFAVWCGAEIVAVGRDCRASSTPFFEAFAAGVNAAGVHVHDLGQVPTDAVYYYSGSGRLPAAMITASHNPPVYNGLKLSSSGAVPIGIESGLASLRDTVIDESEVTSPTPGSTTEVDVVGDYVEHLLRIVDASSVGAMKLAVDGGNGMAGVALDRVFERLDAAYRGLYIEPGGDPNHPADPLVPENTAELVDLVAQGDFDFGVAFDGDADRAFFVDDRAAPLSGSTVTSLVARELLADEPGATIVHNLVISKAVPEVVVESGGTPLRTRVGHSFIKRSMAGSEALFGGEHSGHFYFRDNFGADSGMLSMLMLMRVLSSASKPLSELRSEVERYQSSGEINFEVADTDKALALVEARSDGAAVDRLDGLTVDYGATWFNVRPSNTESLLRLNVEAPTAAQVDRVVADVRSMIGEIRWAS